MSSNRALSESTWNECPMPRRVRERACHGLDQVVAVLEPDFARVPAIIRSR